MLNKIRFISEYEGRSANKHILILIRENIKLFEMQNGRPMTNSQRAIITQMIEQIEEERA